MKASPKPRKETWCMTENNSLNLGWTASSWRKPSLWFPTGNTMIILSFWQGWLYCDALPTNFVCVMSGGLIYIYRMFRIMMNSLLYWQAYFCWLIINDLLASQENKVFEKLKKQKYWKVFSSCHEKFNL